MTRQLRVAFCHPDLGLGGAERLVVDAAFELSQRGHKVDVYTAFHDHKRCFDETVDGSFSVSVAGGWFPRTFLGRCQALCATIRCLLVAFYIWWSVGRAYDVVFVDAVSAVVPLLQCLLKCKVLFYCHYPDMLLVTGARQGLRQAYRRPLDALEEWSTGQADLCLVNSRFTQGVFSRTFKNLARKGIEPQVLYPAVRVPSKAALAESLASWQQHLHQDLVSFLEAGPTFLSINRFERTKDLALAVRALSELKIATQGLPSIPALPVHLILAGGYDARLAENKEVYEELQRLVAALGLQSQVRFLPSFTTAERTALLAACLAVVYTPPAEHFGIVPLEAMAAARPVIACNQAGPLETVVHGVTGLLCRPDPQAFARGMQTILEKHDARDAGFGPAAQRRLLEQWIQEARRHGVAHHKVVSWVRRKIGPDILIWRCRSDGSRGCATPCVLCHRQLCKFDLRVHCSLDAQQWFSGRLTDFDAPSPVLTSGQRRQWQAYRERSTVLPAVTSTGIPVRST
ncbi:hypothetical protein WJX84_003091 [Apatococcus fuscideae]|uniref:Alpha-1,3/1,6-mannosyltransferase ALG2 n=1 Tax=Apatococcus fuscideae TaxID=2026836 RepID=A0AAW1TCX7_9CHLO